MIQDQMESIENKIKRSWEDGIKSVTGRYYDEAMPGMVGIIAFVYGIGVLGAFYNVENWRMMFLVGTLMLLAIGSAAYKGEQRWRA